MNEHGTTRLAALFLLAMCLACPNLLAADFSEVYATYQKAVDAKDWTLALSSSKQALEVGIRSFDPEGENVANLRLNYARQLLRDNQGELATRQLKLCLKAKANVHGASSTALNDVLLVLARSTVQTDVKQARRYYKRSLKIARANDLELLEAKIQLEAGLNLAKAGESKPAALYLKDAQAFYSDRYGNSDVRAGIAGLNLGQVQFSKKDDKRARQTLTTALEAFQAPGAEAKELNMATRKLLVRVLERSGKRDEATPHVIALAQDDAFSGYASPNMLFRGKFVGPSSGRSSSGIDSLGADSGRVTVTYDVDESGYVINPTTTASTKALTTAAIKTVSSLRYSPAIRDGEPAIAHGLEYHYWYKSTLEVR